MTLELLGQPVRGRSCGSCKLCCTLLSVELDDGWSHAGTPCKHLKSTGCGIYPKRPVSCRYWSCRWLFDDGTAELRRPDRTHYVIDSMPDEIRINYPDTGEVRMIQVLQVWVDPRHRDAWRDPKLLAYIDAMGAKHGMAALIRWSPTDALTVFPPSQDTQHPGHGGDDSGPRRAGLRRHRRQGACAGRSTHHPTAGRHGAAHGHLRQRVSMMFFTGMHHPHNAGRVPAAFVSVHAIARRRSAFPARRVILDSGAFTTIAKHGGYPDPVENYAAMIRKVAGWLGRRLLRAVAQDYMCEPHMLAKTGLTLAYHQRLTIERYDALVACDTAEVAIMPVLQGYSPQSYVNHIRQYGARLAHRMWVGVGSVCKRNSNPRSIEAVLLAIKRERPDLRLHGFGVKMTALGSQLVRDLLFSADSMAWSFAARYEGRDGNDPAEAVRYTRRIATMTVQLYMRELV